MNNYSYIQHTDIKGMKWGQRRYQNEDGPLTPAGKIRYGKQVTREMNALDKKRAKVAYRNNPNIKREERYLHKRTKIDSKRTDNNGDRINKKLQKLDAKIAKNRTRIDKLSAKSSDYEAQIDSKFKELTGKGVAVYTRSTRHLVDKATGEVSPFVTFFDNMGKTIGGFKLHDIDENGQSRGYEIVEQRPAPMVKRL